MIQVKVGTNANRTTTVVSPDKTPKEILNDAGVDYSRATVHLDGVGLSTKDMNTSLTDLGVKDSCYIIAVTKQDNNS